VGAGASATEGVGIAECMALCGVGCAISTGTGDGERTEAEATPTAMPMVNAVTILIIWGSLMALVTGVIRASRALDLVNIQHFACRRAETEF
jgi:hypothetical protein